GVENMEIESTNESVENMETESTNEGAENMEIDNTNDLLNQNSLNEGVKSFSELNLTRIENSNNFHDQNNYLYTKMVTKTLSNSFFRCKNYIRHGCPARAVAKYHDLECALLRKQHNHASNIKDVENEKFNKVMDRVFEENVMEKPLKVYLKTKQKLIDQINTNHIAPPKSKESFVYRRRMKKIPKLPKTMADFMRNIENE
ncbi:hypothetical protein Bhyg_07909, partial [Pseudolycoriella hygida]